MQFPDINIIDSLPSSNHLQTRNFTQKVGYWLGHLWTICTSPLIQFIQQLVLSIFNQSAHKTSPPLPPFPKNKISSIAPKDVEVKEAVADTAIVTDTAITGKSDNLVDPTKNPHDEVPASSTSNEPLKTKTSSPKEANPANPVGDKLEDKAGNKLENKEKVEEKVKKVYHFTKFKRRHKLPEQKTDTQTKVVSSAPSKTGFTRAPVPEKQKLQPIIIDNPGKGNCQLYAILKCMEKQYPILLKHQKNLTPQKLRQLGVDFARQQIDSCGPYASEILGYVDSDRKEYNHAQQSPLEFNRLRELTRIETALKNKRMTLINSEKQKKTLQTKYLEALAKVEKRLIKTDEDFLNRLEKDGFFCSTVHLFALSALLKLPIHVRDQKGVKHFDVQMFNPTKSDQNPIHLLRANVHYKSIIYPGTENMG